jgi:hypothetical protein
MWEYKVTSFTNYFTYPFGHGLLRLAGGIAAVADVPLCYEPGSTRALLSLECI